MSSIIATFLPLKERRMYFLYITADCALNFYRNVTFMSIIDDVGTYYFDSFYYVRFKGWSVLKIRFFLFANKQKLMSYFIVFGFFGTFVLMNR
jgi:hypothetical protein